MGPARHPVSLPMAVLQPVFVQVHIAYTLPRFQLFCQRQIVLLKRIPNRLYSRHILS